MKIYIDQPFHKERLLAEFAKYATITTELLADTELIIPTVDETLPTWAASREYMLSKGIRVMVAGPTTIQLCRDKAEFYRVCKRHGVAALPTMQDHLIAKPRFGKGSKGIIKLDKSYVIQPLVSYPEYSVDYFADWDGTPLSIIPRVRMDVVDGESHAAKVIMDDTIIDACKKFGQELGLIGHNVIQGFRSDREFIFSEINPRFGGGSWLTWPVFNSVKWLCCNGVPCSLPRKLSIM